MALDVSVIIVNWNTRQYLLECIHSLMAQTKTVRMEIIVADNGSVDDSVAAVRERFPQVDVIENGDNLGFARASNVGIRRSSGRHVCLVNTDVIAMDGVIDKLVAHLDANPDIGLLGPKTVTEAGKLRQNCRRFPTLRNAAGDFLMLSRSGLFEGRTLPESSYSKTHDAEVLSGCFLLVRREAMDEVGLLDEDFFFYGEDTDWCRRFYRAGWRIVYFADAVAVHFGGGSSGAYPTRYYLAMERADMHYWRKHHDRTEVRYYTMIKIIYHLACTFGWVPLFIAKRDERSAWKLRGHGVNLVWLLTGKSLA